MEFEQALNLIDEQKITHVKVQDHNGKLIMRFDELTPTNVQDKLKLYQANLIHQGKVIFVCATESIYKANWKDAFHWNIIFSGMNNSVSTPGQLGVMPGYISATEALLKQQLADLQNEIKWKKQLESLEKKLTGTNQGGGQYDNLIKLLPLAGLVLKLTPEQTNTIGALTQLSSMMRGETMQTQTTEQSNPINGLNKNVTTLEMTDQEKNDKLSEEIDEEIIKLSEKVELESILKFVKTLNEKPEFLKTLMTLAESHK